MAYSTILRSTWISILVLGVHTASAQSGTFCSVLERHIGQLPGHDYTMSSEELFSAGDLGEVLDLNPASCEILPSSQNPLSCTWQFPYRSDDAAEGFSQLRDLIDICVSDPTDFIKDQNVNHPDYYEAYHYEWLGHTVSVSIKDKSGLQETLVFLRIKSDQ